MVSWFPVKSYAMPKRGPKTIVGQMYPVSAMPSPARLIPLSGLPVPGIGVPIAACVFAAPGTVRNWSRARIPRVTKVSGARCRPVAAAGDIQQRCLRQRPLFGEEVRHLLEPVVLRLLPRKPHTVVHGQLVVHLPVVLDVELRVVVDHVAFDEIGGLQVLREHAGRRVRIPEARIEAVVGVVAEVHVALEREVGDAAGAGVLRLEAVVVVEAGLDRVRAHDLRQADGHVVRAIDVQPAGVPLIRRRRADAAAPSEDWRQIDHAVLFIPPGRPDVVHDFQHVVVVVVDLPGVRIQHREIRQIFQSVRRLVDEHAAFVAARQLVADETPRPLDEGRRVDHVVDVRRVARDVGIRCQDIRESLNRARA